MPHHSSRPCPNFRVHPLAALAVLTASWLLAPALASAAPATITWNTAQTISGDSDVSTTGTFDEAFALGSAGTTINGVTFQGVTSGFGGLSLAIGANDSYSVAGLEHMLSSNFGGSAAPFSSLLAEYQSLLGSVGSPNGATPATLQLGGLTVGTEYQVELWTNDSQDDGHNDYTETATAGNTANFSANTTETTGGVGQYLIGTFTANATTESITIADPHSSSALLSGYEVRTLSAVPEPGTALFGLALSSVCLVSRPRQRRGAVIRNAKSETPS